MPFLSWEEYVFSRNAQNNLDGRLVTFSKAFRETALGKKRGSLTKKEVLGYDVHVNCMRNTCFK